MKLKSPVGFLVVALCATLGFTCAESALHQASGSATAGGGGQRIERLHWEDATAIAISASQDLLELGRETYAARCLICHGKTGAGDGMAADYLVTKPRDFTRAIFKYRTTDQGRCPEAQDLFRSITVAFPLYGMPSCV